MSGLKGDPVTQAHLAGSHPVHSPLGAAGSCLNVDIDIPGKIKDNVRGSLDKGLHPDACHATRILVSERDPDARRFHRRFDSFPIALDILQNLLMRHQHDQQIRALSLFR